MKSFVVTKQQILKALATEPLIGGIWADHNGARGRILEMPEEAQPEQCHVCAVGAVLRSAGFSDLRIADSAPDYTQRDYGGADAHDEASAHSYALDKLKKGNYLGALSSIFEWAYRAGQGYVGGPLPRHLAGQQEARCAAMQFVRDHFPDKLRLNTEYHESAPYEVKPLQGEDV